MVSSFVEADGTFIEELKHIHRVNCILRILCSLNLLVIYVRFDIYGGIERPSSRGHRARMQFPQNFCPLLVCDKQVIESALVFSKFPQNCLRRFTTRAILGKL